MSTIDVTASNAMVVDGSGTYGSATTSATGSNVTLTVPTGTKWEINSVEVDISASAAVASRQLGLATWVGGNLVGFIPTSYSQVASDHIFYNFGEGLPNDTVHINGAVRCSFTKQFLSASDYIQTDITGLQSGDVVTLTVNFAAHSV